MQERRQTIGNGQSWPGFQAGPGTCVQGTRGVAWRLVQQICGQFISAYSMGFASRLRSFRLEGNDADGTAIDLQLSNGRPKPFTQEVHLKRLRVLLNVAIGQNQATIRQPLDCAVVISPV